MVGKNAIYKYMISVVLVVGDVDMWKTTAILEKSKKSMLINLMKRNYNLWMK